jgi:hypothetical protein
MIVELALEVRLLILGNIEVIVRRKSKLLMICAKQLEQRQV